MKKSSKILMLISLVFAITVTITGTYAYFTATDSTSISGLKVNYTGTIEGDGSGSVGNNNVSTFEGVNVYFDNAIYNSNGSIKGYGKALPAALVYKNTRFNRVDYWHMREYSPEEKRESVKCKIPYSKFNSGKDTYYLLIGYRYSRGKFKYDGSFLSRRIQLSTSYKEIHIGSDYKVKKIIDINGKDVTNSVKSAMVYSMEEEEEEEDGSTWENDEFNGDEE